MTDGAACDAVVIGGGLAGLTAAFRLGQAGLAVRVIEATSRLGGQIHTERADGYVIEHGAEGFVARGAAMQKLLEDLSLSGDILDPLTTLTLAEENSGLIELPAGEAARRLGFQVPQRDLGRGIRSLRLGMSQAIDVLADRVVARGGRVDLETSAERITTDAGGFCVVTAAGALRSPRLVVATAAAAAASLLTEVSDRAPPLAQARTLSSLSVTLAYPSGSLSGPLQASGVLLDPSRAAHGARAFSVVSSKFASRAPPGTALFRVFFRPAASELSATDADWVARGTAMIRPFMVDGAEPLLARVHRWPDALPVHDTPHRERIAELDAALEGLGAIRLAGSAFHGAGIEAAVASAEAAARALSPEAPA